MDELVLKVIFWYFQEVVKLMKSSHLDKSLDGYQPGNSLELERQKCQKNTYTAVGAQVN